MPVPMTLDRYAELRAEMEAGARRDDVLAHASMSLDEWLSAQRAWLDKMGAELENGRFELTNHYTQAFLERQRTLAKRAELETASAPRWEQTAPAAPPLPPAPAAPAAPPPPRLHEVSPPVMAAPPAPVAIPPAVHRAPAALTSTRGLDFSAALRPAVPFEPSRPDAAGAVGQAPLSSRVASEPAKAPAALGGASPTPDKRADAPLTGTATFDLSTILPAVPFGSPRGPAPPPSAPAPIAAPKEAEAALSATSAFDASAILAALPFGSGPAAPPAPKPRVAPAPAPRPEEGEAGLTGTATFDLSNVLATLPFAKSAAAPPPEARPAPEELSLGQHASLCAELLVYPTRAAEILSRYRVSEARKTALDAVWKARFAADPSVYSKWYEAYQTYASELRRRHPSG